MSAPGQSRDGGGGGGLSINMVTTVMAFSVSAFFVLFVFTRLLCARIQLRAASAAAHAGDAAFHVERGIRGLEPAVVTSFPTVKIGDGSHRPPAQEESQCAVCLEEYDAKDMVRVLPSCGHAFHVACIDAWLRQHSTCPVCRASLRAAARHLYRAAARASPPPPPSYSQLSTSSSSDRAVPHAEPPSAPDHLGSPDTRPEIVSDEPASTGACLTEAPAPATR